MWVCACGKYGGLPGGASNVCPAAIASSAAPLTSAFASASAFDSLATAWFLLIISPAMGRGSSAPPPPLPPLWSMSYDDMHASVQHPATRDGQDAWAGDPYLLH